ncbi:DUF1642 domain-containing protein [Vagococcus fluvialis]|uniref:DUF1642 domain-containing protein n=1 Tax=Vagococcus fluvialis TaxID=2738 RepID=UPI003BF3BA20
MRIDDENKVVVPDFVAEWYEKTNTSYILGKMLELLEKSDDKRIAEWRWSCKGRMNNGLGNSQEVIAKMMMFGYTIEQPKKYYWRKKKEYLAWFEDRSYTYLNFDKFNEKVMITNATGLKNFTVLFTETEAHDLLKGDFDKFEKVECE